MISQSVNNLSINNFVRKLFCVIIFTVAVESLTPPISEVAAAV